MTPEERAEKAHRDWERALLKEADQPTLPTIHKFITAEIKAAVEEAVREAHPNYAVGHLMGMAKAEAYEDAAKIAETPLPNGSILPVRGEPTNPGAIVDATKTLVAIQIRARAKRSF